MCLALVIRPDGPARKGQESLAHGCMCLAPVIRPYEPAPKGQGSLAQGLPWVIAPTRIALKGPPGTARIGSES